MKKIISLFLLVFSCASIQAQTKEVLFTIDNHPYYTDEFVRVYNKNLDLVKDDSQKNLDKYLELFLGYKLKVEKANKLGLQNNTTYQNELSSYRKQLAKNYVNDSKVTNALIEEAYDRMKNEVRASHILVLVDENAAPADTLKAYNKAMQAKARLDKGENFDTVATEMSEDPSVKENKGDLGYFSAFRMVYPFENAAYKTAVGKVSNPFRTRFGYHVVKVTDKRKNRGEVEVAHIMLLKPTDGSSDSEAKTKIEDLYKKIQQGESFETLAQQFSEDKSTASKGGALPRFGSGQLTSIEFENVAFGLKNNGDISAPFESKFGWHIVKLINKYPLEPFEDLKADIENRVRKDERSLLITNSLAKKLRAKYDVKVDKKTLTLIKKMVTNDYYNQNWEVPDSKKEINEAFVILNKDKKLPASAFLNYIASQQKGNVKVKPISNLVDKLLENWTDDQLIAYYNDNLENEFDEFKYVVQEYRDGLLLFDLMEKEIWNKAKTDTIALTDFYEKNKSNYMWKDRYKVDIFSSTIEKVAKKAQSYLKKGKTIEYIKEKLNKDGKVNIIVKSGLFEKDYDVLPEFNITNKGVTNVLQKGSYFFVVDVKEILPAQVKEMNECRGKLISDFQQELENNWVDNLKKEFDVKINQEVFESVKKTLNK